MKKISIIIRTKNEERWIGHCLQSIYEQDYQPFEIILVDNQSSDKTIEIAKRFPVDKFINIEKFKPGKAINLGIKASVGDLICCISAHCIPKDRNWLSNLAKNLIDQPNVAGVYGRQIPMSFTDDIDKRDLLIVFGRDKRIQKKDYFFHNANSMFTRAIWNKFSFDEEVTNIEDRVWGKKIIEAGLTIIYEPEAEVFHYHGLHQGNNPKRAKGVVSVIEKIDDEYVNELPKSMLPDNLNVIAIIPVSKSISSNSKEKVLLDETINYLKSSTYLKSIYILSDQEALSSEGTQWLDRKKINNSNNLNLDELMQNALVVLEQKSIFPDSLIYLNYDYVNKPDGFIDDLIIKFAYGGFDSAFGGFIDYSHYWFKNKEGVFAQTDESFSNRENRDPIYRALYGLGCISSSHNILKGKLISGKIGILPLNNDKFAKRYTKN